MERGRFLFHEDDSRCGPGARGGARGQRRSRPALDRRFGAAGQAPPSHGADDRRARRRSRSELSAAIRPSGSRSALPDDGRLITLEWSGRHAEVARRNVARAGLSAKVEVRQGAALETLPKIEAEGLGPFDFVFIDADKENNAAYLEWALRLSRPGTAIVVDNVVRDGEVADARSADPDVVGVRRMFDLIAREKRLSATAIQTVGAKGWDGFALAVVK